MQHSHRQSTGIPRLDEALGGGLIPGTLTVIMGATGIGKTQLGLSYANAGLAQDGEREEDLMRRLGRAMYVARHRGSACTDQILPYEFNDAGFRFTT